MRSSHAPRRRVATLVRVSVVALLAGLLHVLAAAPASAARPDGWVDVVVSNSPGYVTVAGWAWDPDAPAVSIDVHFYIGSEIFVLRADQYRSDVGAHGFSATIAVQGTGQLSWNAYGIDVIGSDGNWPLQGGSGTVTIVDPSPIGGIDSSSSSVHRTIDIAGWASDPNAPTSTLPIGVYIGGPVGTPGVEVRSLTASLARSDGRNGFSGRLSTTKTGAQQVYVYAGNAPGTPGFDRLIGTVQVTIYVDSTPPNTKILSAPDTATTNDVIHVTFSADEPNATFQCRWDLDPWSACQSGAQIKLSPGKHQISVRATDAYGNQDATPAVFLVTVTSAPATPPPPPPPPTDGQDPRSIAAKAVKKKSKLRIDVAPDSASSNYRVVIQRKVGKRWRKVDRVRTRGAKDAVVVNLRRGKYRVVLPKSAAGPALKSNTVRLRR